MPRGTRTGGWPPAHSSSQRVFRRRVGPVVAALALVGRGEDCDLRSVMRRCPISPAAIARYGPWLANAAHRPRALLAELQGLTLRIAERPKAGPQIRPEGLR
ncbi:MAG: hypothetical protein ACRD0K_24100 [Egibacteraceae bacterium]